MSDTAAFRSFAIEPPYQVRSIRKMVEQRISDLRGQISGGYARDWADYNRRVGRIEGLIEAMEFCDEMEKAEKK